MATVNKFNELSNDIKQQHIIAQQQKEIRVLTKELALYKKYCNRPVIIKEIIHHLARGRDSVCLYGIAAYDEIVYE